MPIATIPRLSFSIILFMCYCKAYGKWFFRYSFYKFCLFYARYCSYNVWSNPHRNDRTDFWYSVLFLRNTTPKLTVPVTLSICHSKLMWLYITLYSITIQNDLLVFNLTWAFWFSYTLYFCDFCSAVSFLHLWWLAYVNACISVISFLLPLQLCLLSGASTKSYA